MNIRTTHIDTTCTIFNKGLQIWRYAYDVDMISRDMRSLTTGVDSIVGASDEMGLQWALLNN